MLAILTRWATWLTYVLALAGPVGAVQAQQSDACTISRAVIAGETALRDALSHSTVNAAPLRAALAQLAKQLPARPPPALNTYLASRTELLATLRTDGVLAARRLARDTSHIDIGQITLLTLATDNDCGFTAPNTQTHEAQQTHAGSQVTGGHGGAPQPGTDSATGSGEASQPGGKGMATAPLSFLRNFNAQWHVIPAMGATLAFGALFFVLTRNRRQHRRYLCHLPVDIRTKDRTDPAILLDISQGGGKIVRAGNWDVGARLHVHLTTAEDPIPARVVWANKGFVGLNFRKPLTTAELGAILQRAKAGAGAALQERF
ncbi:MAG: PilZ domain-containing protein [Pikeienuella sp.]